MSKTKPAVVTTTKSTGTRSNGDTYEVTTITNDLSQCTARNHGHRLGVPVSQRNG